MTTITAQTEYNVGSRVSSSGVEMPAYEGARHPRAPYDFEGEMEDRLIASVVGLHGLIASFNAEDNGERAK